MYKIKLRRGDKVRVIAGKDKGKEGKILVVDRKANRVIVEGINIIKKHQKARGANQQSGIIEKEAPIHASNVMFLFKGKPVRLGYKIDGEKKIRIARPTGEVVD